MSDIVGKIVKPTAEFLGDMARKLPQAFGKGHHRMGTAVHKAADDFDRAEDELTAHAGHRPPGGGGGHHDPADVGGTGPAAASRAAGGGRAVGDADRQANSTARQGAADPERSGRPADGRCLGGDPVDLLSGEMVLRDRDVALPGVLSLLLDRTHLSGYRSGRLFGRSWASTLDERLEADDEGVVLATADGMLLVYPVPRPGAAVLPSHGPRRPLEWDGTPGSPLRVTDPESGVTRHFAPMPEAAAPPYVLALSAVTDRNGNQITVERSAAGTPVAVRHSGGYTVAVETRDGRVTALRLADPALPQDGPAAGGAREDPTQPAGTVLRRFGYDGRGDLVEVVNASGAAQRLEYDGAGRITAHTDRTGFRYAFTYDGADRCVSGTGDGGVLSFTMAYDDAARTTRYTDSLGRTTVYAGTERLELAGVTDPLGATVTHTWDGEGRLVARTDALGHTSRYSYDAAGRITRAVLPDGGTTSCVYDRHGNVVRAELPGGTWLNGYDERGNLVSVTDPAGVVTRYGYDGRGGLVSVTDAAGAVRLAVCDAAGLVVRHTDPAGGVTTLRRDAAGRVTEATDAAGAVTRLSYTPDGALRERQGPDGGREFFERDGEGRLVAQTGADGSRSVCEVGPFGVLLARTLDDGTRYRFGYDTELNLLRVTGPDGREWHYEYDAANRVTAETDFGGRRVRYENDAAGQLVRRVNGAGEPVEFGRDALGRTVAVRCGGQETAFTYDGRGAPVRESGPDAEIERVLDARGLLLSETVNGRTTTYAYDALGRRVRRVTPTGIESTWSYDTAGRPEALEAAGHRLAFAFDAEDRETGRSLPGGAVLTHAWDPAGRLAGQRLVRGGEVLQERSYSYGAGGVLSGLDELTTGPRRFTLDGAGRITAAEARGWSERYVYDEVGNITRAAAPGAPDDGERVFEATRFVRDARTRVERDGEGRPVRTVRRLLNGQRRVTSYRWDGLNRLAGVTAADGGEWSYAYDAAGRRLAKRRLRADGSVAAETVFVWDGDRLIGTIDGERSTGWDYAPGSFRPVTQVERSPGGEVRFHAVVTDLSGMPRELVDADGSVAWRRRATVWGEDLDPPGGSGGVDCPLRFPGQYADPETGWFYNRHRHYDPRLGQYATPDPLGLLPAPNDFGYVPNPFSLTDPLGLGYQDPSNGRFARDPALGPVPEGGPEFTRKNQYPTGYWQSTHDHMTSHYTDEGRLANNQVPMDAGNKRIPRDQLTWRDGNDRMIWNPNAADHPKPFHQTVTYEHRHPVVDHWNSVGRFKDRTVRDAFYNNTADMEPMLRDENSQGGGKMKATYSQETGQGYSCDRITPA